MKNVLIAIAIAALPVLAQDAPAPCQKPEGAKCCMKGKMPCPDMRAKFMEKFDANKDGQLDDQEKAAVKADMEARKAEFEKMLLEKFDANKDGQLDDQEKAAMKADFEARKGGPRHHGPRHGKKGPGKFHGPDMRAKFMEKFDANKDGQLDDQEKAAVKADMEARKAEFEKMLLEKFDANKDGQLDDQEKAAMKADFEARKGGPRHHGPRHGKKGCDCGCKKD